jgi:crotonobetainyl-CoA:carnitine CoA-transferase CaiB-like acyl-CoA transferase
LTALYALWATLAVVISERETGKRQSIDLAQHEAIHHVLGGTMVEYFQRGVVRERHWNPYHGDSATRFVSGERRMGGGRRGDRGHLHAALPRDRPGCERSEMAERYDQESVDGIEFDAILRGWISERPSRRW